MLPISGFNTSSNGYLKKRKFRIVFGVQTFLLDELPKPFDEIEVGGIGWQTEQLYAKRVG